MYKVFIDNTPLYIVESQAETKKNAVYIYTENIKDIKAAVFMWAKKVKNACPIYIVTQTPELIYAKLFENFDFIEAAGGIVKNEKGYLFIKRNGSWDIPKGKLDKGESPETGAVREIEEECGIIGPIIERLIDVTYHTYKLKNRPKIKKTYWYELVYTGNEELVAQAEEGITKAKWATLSDLKKIKENTFGSILDVMNTYFDKTETMNI